MSGDVEILARVDSLSAADPWSKIGVMVRSDLTQGAAMGAAGSNGIAFRGVSIRGRVELDVDGRRGRADG